MKAPSLFRVTLNEDSSDVWAVATSYTNVEEWVKANFSILPVSIIMVSEVVNVVDLP